MQGVLYFVGRFVAAVVLSVVCLFAITFLLNFILPIFAGSSNFWKIGNAVSGFLMFLPPVAVFIACFADEFTIKERVGAAFLTIIHSIWITVAFLIVGNMFLGDILRFLGFTEPAFAEQIIYMLAIAALMCLVGFLTLRNLPYRDRSFKLFSAPPVMQIFGVLLALVIVCEMAAPLLSRAETMESLAALDTMVKSVLGREASKLPSHSELPMLYNKYGAHIGFILLIILTIGVHKSIAARSLFLIATALLFVAAYDYYSSGAYSYLSDAALTAEWAGYVFQLLAAILIMTPAARRWIRESRNEAILTEAMA